MLSLDHASWEGGFMFTCMYALDTVKQSLLTNSIEPALWIFVDKQKDKTSCSSNKINMIKVTIFIWLKFQ